MTLFNEFPLGIFVKFVVSMKIRFFNSNTEHKRFGYSPMYFDERKERLAHKKEQYQRIQDGEMSKDERRDMLRDNLRSEFSRADYRRREQKTSNIRIILLIGVLLVLGYLVFNGVSEVDTIVNKLW